MKVYLLKLTQNIDAVIDRLGKWTSWLTTALVILICADVVMRYLFSSTKTWILELEWHLFSVIFLIGASYTLLHDKHVRVDLFYERLKPGRKKWIDAAGIVFLLLPWCAVVMYTSLDYTLNSFYFRETSSQPNGLPARYVIKAFIFLGFTLLFLQGVSIVVRSFLKKESDV